MMMAIMFDNIGVDDDGDGVGVDDDNDDDYSSVTNKNLVSSLCQLRNLFLFILRSNIS